MTIPVEVQIILYFILWCFKIFNNIRKKLLRQYATSASSETKFLFSIKVIFPQRKGLIVCQNLLLSVISFSSRLAKYFFFSFRNSDTHQFLCLLQENLFAADGSFKNLFLNFVLYIIALDNALFINRLLFSRTRTSIQTL